MVACITMTKLAKLLSHVNLSAGANPGWSPRNKKAEISLRFLIRNAFGAKCFPLTISHLSRRSHAKVDQLLVSPTCHVVALAKMEAERRRTCLAVAARRRMNRCIRLTDRETVCVI